MQWTADNLQGLPGPDGSLPGKSLVSPNQPENDSRMTRKAARASAER